jgi:hypothetical protein
MDLGPARRQDIRRQMRPRRVLLCVLAVALALPALASAQGPPLAPFKAKGLDVHHEAVVYQKDVGPNTATVARGIKLFNPDRSWTKA